MIQLRAIRLINWYHFVDETLRITGSCLLLGDNGCGKSTILDAVQFALVADQSQARFNKAANEHSRRTLYSYVRFKLGSEDEARPGQVRFGRTTCTSYIVLQFSGEESPANDFLCGVVMEAGEADTTVNRWHFILPRTVLEDLPLVGEGDMVRTAREFRAALRELPQARVWPDAATYRAELRHRLGVLPDAFHRLIVKSLDFKPIGQVRDFVFQYLLDERPVDTLSLQANLENYKKLEAQAKDAQRRIESLDAVCAQGERIAQERRTAERHRYLALRAELELAEAHEREIVEQIEVATRRLGELEAELRRTEDQISFLDGERDRLIGLLHSAPNFQTIQSLERDLENTRREIQEAADAEARARRILDGQTTTLELFLSQEARDLRRTRPELFEGEALIGCAEEPAVVARLRATLLGAGSLEGRDLATWTKRLERASDALRMGALRLKSDLDTVKVEGRALEAERAELERGRQRYPDGAEALLHLLRAKLKGAREPRPLCELIEVSNPRWRDAVEGYLNTRRFDVIVAPEDFPRALSLYERHKSGYAVPGRGEVFISNVGLVDIERMEALARRPERRSLAEQVEAEDALARTYVDFLLGDVICCDDEQELRRHRRSITDTVMVYQGYVARQTPPDVFRRHYIGEAARVRRLEEIGRRLAELSQLVIDLARDIEWLDRASSVSTRARNEVVELSSLVERAQRLHDLKRRAGLLEIELLRIDRKEIEKLQNERKAVEEEKVKLDSKRKETVDQIGRQENESERLGRDRSEAQGKLAAAAAAMEGAFGELSAEARAGHEEHYARERQERSAEDVREIFERQHRNIATRVENLVRTLVRLKTEYANAHGFLGEVEGDGYAEFDSERDLWRESRLPEYQERIIRAKEEAIQQLTEDIIFRLRENLVDVRRQVDELNRALKDVSFGSERYQFTLEVAPDHKDFHDLIMDAGMFEKESIFGSAALSNAETKKTLEGLFERLVQGEAREVKSELEERADYREYFNYDLKIHHADGTWSLYDRVAGDKSGGETQNPYYIAIFASIYRLYRGMSPEGGPTCGLVLLDEAFSKMDEARIAATLRFARDLGLQLLLATPKERSELVAPAVETSLYIHKDARSGVPAVLDFTKEFERDGNAPQEGAEGDPAEASRGLRA
jgi:uncharacterized protein YPO0396